MQTLFSLSPLNMRRLQLVLFMCLTILPSMGDVELYTSINDMTEGGACERAGAITMSVNDDDFDIDPGDTIYLRISFSDNITLCQTLVDPLAGDTPIYLAMSLNTADTTLSMAAPADTVSIARWKAGESAIWLAISANSNEWIQGPGGLQAPSDANRVNWTVGISGQVSHDQNENQYANGLANLPFNTSDLSTTGDLSDATDCETMLDLSNSPLGDRDLVFIDMIAFSGCSGVLTSANPSGISCLINGINMVGDFIVGRVRAASPAPAGIEMETSPRVINHLGIHERAGSVTMSMLGDGFAAASPQNPAYMRLKLTHRTTLSRTMVNPLINNRPIYVALSLESDDPTVTLNASPDAVTIVRWIAGEEAIWLRITQPTSQWLLKNGTQTAAPDSANRVSWTLGVSRFVSFRQNRSLYLQGLANLPANSYSTDVRGFRGMASTLFFVDATSGLLEPTPGFDQLYLEPLALEGTTGVTTEVDADNIGLGLGLPVFFSGDSLLAVVTGGYSNQRSTEGVTRRAEKP